MRLNKIPNSTSCWTRNPAVGFFLNLYCVYQKFSTKSRAKNVNCKNIWHNLVSFLKLDSHVGHCVLLQDPYAHASSIVDILRAGPEPLQSHFSTGYGMVLKILNTRSLEYAQSFVKRSFYNYLGEDHSINFENLSLIWNQSEHFILSCQLSLSVLNRSYSPFKTCFSCNQSVRFGCKPQCSQDLAVFNFLRVLYWTKVSVPFLTCIEIEDWDVSPPFPLPLGIFTNTFLNLLK